MALLLTASIVTTIALEVLAPAADGLVLGDRLTIEVSRASAPPSSVRLDGAPVASAPWARLPLADHWIAEVPIGGHGSSAGHVLEITANGKTTTRAFTTIHLASEAGDPVARHFLAAKPLDASTWQWGPAVFTYGLAKYAKASPDRARFVASLERYYARHASALPKIDYPDRCAPALGALALARGENVNAGLSSARAVADYLRTEPRNVLGAIDHLGAHGHLRFWASIFPPTHHWAHSIWVDSLVMYAVFATQWGAWTGDSSLRELGAAQPGIFAARLQDPGTGLFTHAWDVKHARTLGARWLRGNGWVVTSVVEILDELPANHPRRPELERILASAARGLAAKRMANDLWDTLVDVPGAGYEESSGSALVAYALAKGARKGWLPASARVDAKRTFEALTARLERAVLGGVNGFALAGTSTATNPTGEWFYTVVPRRADVDYGVGAYLLLASELSTERWP